MTQSLAYLWNKYSPQMANMIKVIIQKKEPVFLLVGLVCLFPYVLIVYSHLGIYVRRIDHFPGPCKVLSGVSSGSEDIALTSDGLAFISSGMRSFGIGKSKIVEGNIYLFDFKKSSSNVTKLNISSKTINFKTFEPHGISLYENKVTLEILLFVVDHSSDVDVVRIFAYKRGQKTLHHIDSVKDANFKCLNNVAAVGPKQFYVTNYAYFCKSSVIIRTIEEVLSLLMSTNVVFFDGIKARIVADKLRVANGVSLSPDKTMLYVASTMARELVVYQRNLTSHSLKKLRGIPLKSYPDNVIVDANTGDLYVGTHPYLLPLFLRDYTGKRRLPANILRLHSIGDAWQSYRLAELLYSSGKNFVQGASAAAFHNGQLLVGSIHHKLGYCKVRRY